MHSDRECDVSAHALYPHLAPEKDFYEFFSSLLLNEEKLLNGQENKKRRKYKEEGRVTDREKEMQYGYIC